MAAKRGRFKERGTDKTKMMNKVMILFAIFLVGCTSKFDRPISVKLKNSHQIEDSVNFTIKNNSNVIQNYFVSLQIKSDGWRVLVNDINHPENDRIAILTSLHPNQQQEVVFNLKELLSDLYEEDSQYRLMISFGANSHNRLEGKAFSKTFSDN